MRHDSQNVDPTFSSIYVEGNLAVVNVFFDKQGFLKQIRGKIYDELVREATVQTCVIHCITFCREGQFNACVKQSHLENSPFYCVLRSQMERYEIKVFVKMVEQQLEIQITRGLISFLISFYLKIQKILVGVTNTFGRVVNLPDAVGIAGSNLTSEKFN